MSLIERVRARCVEEGDCWIWHGGCAGKSREQPQISVNGEKLYVRRALYALRQEIPKGKGITTTCQTFRCVNPAHLIESTRSQRMARAGAQGKFSGPVRCSKIAAHKQALHSKLTREQVAEIRRSDASAREAAQAYGISYSAVSCIRRGIRWRDYSSPFAGLGQ